MPHFPEEFTVTTLTDTLFSRAIPFCEDQARPGDQINTAYDGDEPCWLTLRAVVPCTDANADAYDCDGGCALVLHLEALEDGDPEFWHVDWADYGTVQTRLPVGGAR